ncbi:MAG: outer membrane protein transport protein [Elusimicrobiaceae bacterium]|nr:outer membrane protein transport protein [Elusimicrobiaceae bacterium]
MKKLLLTAFLAACVDLSYGAGFALYEYSGRSTAMGGAVMASSAEPASLAANPALITELDGTQMQLGGTVVTAHAKTTINSKTTGLDETRGLQRDVWFLPNFYITHKWSEDVTFGLGAFSRFGLGGTYKNHSDWYGSYLAYKVKLETFSFTPTIAIKANDQLSMAMGLEAMTIDFTQNSNGPFPPGSTYEIHGDGLSWGGNFSLIYRPEWAEKWSIGAMYRTKVKQNLNGYIHTSTGGTISTPVPTTTPPYYTLEEVVRHADAKGSITLPDSLSLGVAFRPDENWTFEVGAVGTMWSSYDQITIEYKDQESAPTIHNRKEYKDTIRANFGMEYQFIPKWFARAGYVYDKSPINEHAMDTLVPVDDRHLASIGLGYKGETWSADFAYTHIFGRHLTGDSNTQFGDRAMRYSGGRSDMFAFTVGYKF